jgi:Ni/Co efflux regulator RcnB
MKTTLIALCAVATLAGTATLAQSANDQAQADYQAKQAQYEAQKAQYEDKKAQYQDQKREYHHDMAKWAAGQEWPQRYWDDHYVVNDWSGAHLHDPGVGYRWYRDADGNLVRVQTRTHVIEEVYVP